MKIAFRIFTTLIFCLLLSACNGNKEDNNLREEFSVAEDLGIYKDGAPVLTFLKKQAPILLQPVRGHPEDNRQRGDT